MVKNVSWTNKIISFFTYSLIEMQLYFLYDPIHIFFFSFHYIT